MKKILFSIAIYCTLTANAQNYLISFAGTGASSTVNTVRVENLTAGTSRTLNGNDILHLTGTTGINPVENGQSHEMKIYPNPMTHYSTLEIYPPVTGDAIITIYEITGKRVFNDQSYLENCRQEFRISGFSSGVYLIIIKSRTYQYSGKLLCTGKSNGKISIEKVSNYIQSTDRKKSEMDYKGTRSTVEMAYTTGDRLKFTGISGIYSTIMMDIPTSDKTFTFNFIACTDGDNKNYPTVKIGTQTWMAENLETTKFNNGTAIPLVTGVTEWVNLTTPGYCWYENNEVIYGDIYGALYNWYALNTTTNGGKNVCPTGWHLPGDPEWKQLEMHLGMSQIDADKLEWRGTSEGGELKETGINHWDSPNTGAENDSGFTALAGGYRGSGYFTGIRYYGLWWSATESEYNATYSWRRSLSCMNADIYRYYSPKTTGLSVRCVKDN